jgi:C4-dicarboxylate-specific signal transduction histidine kinase
MIPKIDGLDLCARIKQDEACRGIKIILLTARIDEEAKITALNNGADDFLTKPFSTLELQTRVRNLLRTTEFEQQLVRTNQDLKQTLHELKDTQAQLIQSEKTHALEYLSAGILHEINNPLNYTLTALQLAKGLPAARDSDMLLEIFQDMNEGMCRIKDIVSDLQTFAHPSPVAKQSSFKFAQALKTALTFTSQDVGSVVIRDETDKDVQVIGSKNHIVQVLINLITNALKAVRAVAPLRTGEILISTSVQDNRLLITVRDNGTGIDQVILDKIFDPFFTTRDVGEGMGLGLSVSQTIVKAHGGQLKANSIQGEWTEFSFDLELSTGGA